MVVDSETHLLFIFDAEVKSTFFLKENKSVSPEQFKQLKVNQNQKNRS